MNRVRMKCLLMLGLFLFVLGTSSAEEFLEQPLEDKPNITLTGIPQIDYIHDPNLPRELNGYNLSTYPFLNSMPKNLTFKCDGRHDGFYASIEWNCQVYHHCLFGIRYDFICANFTSFDQRNFICTFASDVDCPNSERFYDRNEALYKTTSTTTEVNPFLGVLRNQRPRRPHPQLARLRGGGERLEQFDDDQDEDYDLPVIPKQRAEESNPRFPQKTELAAEVEPVNNKVSQDLSKGLQAQGEVPARGVAGPGRLRAIKPHRRRPGKRRRPFRPAYYDYYDYYDDLYDDVTGDEYDYDYASNVRLSNRRPGQRRPNQGKGGAANLDSAGQPPPQPLKDEPSKQPVPEVSPSVVADEKKEQVLLTPQERRKLFQQREPSKLRLSQGDLPSKSSSTAAPSTTKTTTTTAEPEIEYYYDYEYEDEIDNAPANTQTKLTTVKTESVPKLQPAFRRAGLPERQVRTEEPPTSSPVEASKNRAAEEPAGAAKLRNRLQTLRVKDTPKNEDEPEEPEQVETTQLTTEKAVTKPLKASRIQRPSAGSSTTETQTEASTQRIVEITTFRAQKSRRLNSSGSKSAST